MSDKNIARRALAEISFDGTDITKSIRPYFKSLTYTDNEEGEADDLQITLQDRDGIWMEKWLNDAIDAAANSTGGETSESNTYTVTAKIGLNVRKGPGTNYEKIGALSYGATVEVLSIENGWAQIEYAGRTAYVSAQYLKQEKETAEETGNATTGLKIEAVILRQNWNGDGKDEALECGIFELDSLVCDGPPAEVKIKATSLPYDAQIRQTEKSKGWEEYNLSGIAGEMASKNGMVLMFLSGSDPYYERVEQRQMSDIAFLRKLCRDAGISLKASSKMLILFDQQEYESKDAVLTIHNKNKNAKPDEKYLSYELNIGTENSRYQSCRVSYNDPKTGKKITATAKVPDYSGTNENNQQLEITAKVSSTAEAMKLAEKQLRLHNRNCRGADFTMPGNPKLAAGVTVKLEGWGGWDGKYIVRTAAHTVGGSGYTTAIQLNKVLEGY